MESVNSCVEKEINLISLGGVAEFWDGFQAILLGVKNDVYRGYCLNF